MIVSTSALKVLALAGCLWSSHAAGSVRGTSKTTMSSNRKLTDYTIMDPMVNATAADPEHLYPLGRCQGDCDEDNHCQHGLKCFERDAHEHVPGCTGGEQDGTGSDYCIRLEDFPDNAGTPSPSSRPSTAPSHIPSTAPSSAPTYPWGDLTVVPEPVNRPLGECEGDCDKDEDCEDGLVCFMRDSYQEPVPGCNGPRDGSRTDYCVFERAVAAAPSSQPSSHPSSHPSTAPSNHPSGQPSSHPSTAPSPLPSSHPSGVPSHLPSSHPSSHPSYQPSPVPSAQPSNAPSKQPSSAPSPAPFDSGNVLIPIVDHGATPPDSKIPMGLCEGDCDNDSDCDPGLTCKQRDPGDDVPGCTGDFSSASDFCVKSDKESSHPSSAPSKQPSGAPSPAPFDSGSVLIPIVDHGATPPDSKIPMVLCEGDCDNDSDCAPGLICKQRDPGDDVPGCTGDFSSASDFCVKSDKKAPLIDYGETPPANFKPLRFCEGDCDHDSDCGKGMICKQRNPGDEISGCEGDRYSASDFCVWP